MKGLRCAPRPRPWDPIRAHLTAVGAVVLACVVAGIVLMALQAIAALFFPVGVSNLPHNHWVLRLGWLAVGTLVAPLGLGIPALVFIPLTLLLLRIGYGGALSLAALGSLIGTAAFLNFPEPTLVGTIGGALIGWVYGRAFHYAAGRTDWKW